MILYLSQNLVFGISHTLFSINLLFDNGPGMYKFPGLVPVKIYRIIQNFANHYSIKKIINIREIVHGIIWKNIIK